MGALGSLARLGLSEALPRAGDGFPLATFAANVVGCLLIGVLMVYVVEVGTASRYLRPFVGTGVLGGFTTFSAYSVETHDLWAAGAQGRAVAYAAASVIAALLAVQIGVYIGRLMAQRRRN